MHLQDMPLFVTAFADLMLVIFRLLSSCLSTLCISAFVILQMALAER
jgi:hypothetical protein